MTTTSVPGPASDQAASPASLLKVLSTGPAGSGSGPVTSTMAFAWRAILKIRHVPEQLIDVTATPVMLTLLFAIIFGGALGGSVEAYLQFFIPGVVVQSVLFTTVYTGVSLNTDLSKGVSDRFRSMPVWTPAPLVGAQLADLVRYTIASVVVLLVGFILGYRPDGGLPGLVAGVGLLLVFAFGLGWIFAVVGQLLKTPSSVLNLSFLVLFPLTFVSNAFVDPATMPEWVQWVVNVNPVSHLVTAVRASMTGALTAAEAGAVILASVVLAGVFAPIAIGLYRRR